MNNLSGYDAVTQGVAFYELPGAGFLSISGDDRVRFLQRQTTNDIELLAPDRVIPTVLTSSTARILDVFYLVYEPKAIDVVPLPGHAQETAHYLKSRIFFKERSFGQLEGMRDEDVELTDPGIDFRHPYHTIGKTGESMVDLYIRANQAVQNLLRRPIGRYRVVSHGAILNMVLFSILGLSPQGRIHSPGFRFQNASFATLTYIPDQRVWMVLGLNDHAH